MKFLLTSSGLRNKEIIQALTELVGKPSSETTVLFILTAANTSSDDKSWIIDNLMQFRDAGFVSIDILDIAGLSRDMWELHVIHADVICFGGGNEKYLARVIEASGIKEILIPLLTQKVYMGISAGSMVAGEFMDQLEYEILFPEENLSNEDGSPMKLLNCIFIPHLNSDWFTHVRKEELEKRKGSFTAPVYALDDYTALKVDGGVIEIVGDGDSWVLKK